MISLRTEWFGEVETGYPPRSLKFGIPATVIKGGDGSAATSADWAETLIFEM